MTPSSSSSTANTFEDTTHWIRIDNLDHSVSEEDLIQFFKSKDIVESPTKLLLYHHSVDTLIVSKRLGPMRLSLPGYARIECKDHAVAEQMVSALQLTELEGARMWVQLMRERVHDRNEWAKGKRKKVILHDVHRNVTRSEIEEICYQYGDVEEVSSIEDFKCTVTMEDEESAETVFNALNGLKLHGLLPLPA